MKNGKKNKKKYFLLQKWFLIICGIVIFIILFWAVVLRDLPSPTKLNNSYSPEATEIFDRNGHLLYAIYKNKYQSFIPLSSIPKYMQEATIAVEDKSFYNHGAIDLKGILRALVSIVFHHQLQGGSTITQQLVKNSLLTPQQTILRKIREVILSFATQAIYSKKQILTMYLNQIPYGGTAWGIQAAAQTYFGKKASSLDLAQSSLLAGLPEAPTAFSPFGANPQMAKERQTLVLKDMYQQGYITKKQENQALREKLSFKKLSQDIKAPHFVLYIKNLLVQQYGEKMVEQGGLKVITSLDLPLQNFVQQTVSTQISDLGTSYHVTNGAALVTDPATGEILAMVGSKNYFDTAIDGNINMTISPRQPGSSIKPINYAVGLLKSYTAATPFVDEPTCFKDQGGLNYCPGNYDGKWHGVVQMRYALGNSINIPAVKMLELNGVKAMIATASAMGITTFTKPQDYGLSLTLGGGAVKMTDMATAYGVFANGGYRINLHPILKVVDRNGRILQQYNPPPSPIFGTQVLPPDVTFIISNILADNNARLIDFGSSSALNIPGFFVPVKTGTTDNFRDNWTIGYTPSLVVAVWVGNTDNSPMGTIASGITGAAPIWHDIMVHLLLEKGTNQIQQRPSDIIQKEICSVSGLLPPPVGTPNRCQTRFEYFIKGTDPKKIDPGLQKVAIDNTTQDLASPGATTNVSYKMEQVVGDPTGALYCVTCPHQGQYQPPQGQ